MFDRIKKMFNNEREKTYISGANGHKLVGNLSSTFSFYKGTSYDNTYPSIAKIANEFMTIRPYAIDANGKPLNKAPLIDKIYHPNQQMSSADFREALAVMALVYPKVYLLVHHYENGVLVVGGNITPDNIAGFTFLEGVSEQLIGSQKVYNVNGKQYTENEVIEIYAGINPYNLNSGYAPSSAAAKWANLDDYIATYQTGLFENGAIPAGQFIITASTVDAFNDIVDEMQKRHRGSGRNNNVVYTHRPISETTGTPIEAQIEWVPFAQNNKDLKLSEIFDQANKKIDSVFGVPASIRGVNDNNTYASVRVDEQLFIKYTVIPFTTKLWTRFTHEMNRITGGLGYAITFDKDVPGVADEAKINADRKLSEINVIERGMMLGYSLDSIIDAFELSNSYKLLEVSNTPPQIVNDKPEVDEGYEVNATPNPTADKNFLCGLADKNELGVVYDHKQKRQKPDNQKVVDDLANILRNHNQKLIDQTLKKIYTKSKDSEEVEPIEETPAEEVNKLVVELLTVCVAYMLIVGKKNYKEGKKLLKNNDVSLDNITEYAVSEAQKANYQAYLLNVAKSFDNVTRQKINTILTQSIIEQWNKEIIATQLRDVMNIEEWRVQRLARTEEHRSVGQASIDSMTQLMNETGTTIYKKWFTNLGEPCEFCQAMDGKIEVVNKPFVSLNGVVEGSMGGKFINNFTDVESANLHPNCTCSVRYFVEGDNEN